MVEHHPDTDPRLDLVFRALADPTRRQMLRQLADAPCSVGELAAPFAMSLAAASKHVRVLEQAGLLQREVLGRVHQCRLQPAPLHAGFEWLRHYEAFWQARLDALAALLDADARRERARATPPPSTATRRGGKGRPR